MNKQRKIIAYATGVVLGCLILSLLPKEDAKPQQHPWHAQTAPEGTYPLTVQDSLARTLTFEKQPRHFISLAPSITETLFAMGMGDHLMAVSEWCNYPEEAKALKDAGAHIGSLDAPNLDLIQTYNPDLVIGSTSCSEAIYDKIHALPRTIAMALEQRTIDDIFDTIKAIGKATGVPGKALALISRLSSEQESIAARVEAFQDQPKPTTVLLLSLPNDGETTWTPGGGTWPHELIEAAHARNLAASINEGWGPITLKTLAQLNPDILLIRDASSENGKARLRKQLETIRQNTEWQSISAVQNDRLHILPSGPLTVPGPRIMEAYRAIAEAIWSPLNQTM